MMETQTREFMLQCPMASVCRVMAEKRIPFILILPRLLLILIEVIILIEPKILVWPMAVLAIILGFFFLMIANFIHGWVNRREAHMVDPKWQPQNGGWIYFLSDARFWPKGIECRARILDQSMAGSGQEAVVHESWNEVK